MNGWLRLSRRGWASAGPAKLYKVSYSTVINWVARSSQTGSPALPMGGKTIQTRGRIRIGIYLRRLADNPDITGQELLAELHERKVDVSYYAVAFLDRAGLSYKKLCA